MTKDFRELQANLNMNVVRTGLYIGKVTKLGLNLYQHRVVNTC